MRRLASLWLLLALVACTPKSPQHHALLKLGVKVNAPKGVDTVVYRRTVSLNGRDSVAGRRVVISRVIEAPNGQRQLEVAQRFPGGGGEIVDTAVAELRTLFAVSHDSHQPTKTMHFDLRDYFADGEVTDTSRRKVAVHQALGGPVFDSNIIETVVASLPLERGYRAELPFFIYERGGRVPMRVSVVERARESFLVGNRDAWVVSVAVPGAPATMWIDVLERVPLRVRYDISGRPLSFTDERMTLR